MRVSSHNASQCANHYIQLSWLNWYFYFKKAYDSVRREVLYNILMVFGTPKKLIRLIKMCLTKTYGSVRVGKNLPDMLPIRNGLKQGDALSPLLFYFALSTPLGGSR